MEGSTQEIAEVMGIDYIVASNLLKFLEDRGLVKRIGKRKADGGKGKPSIIFEVPEQITFSLKAQR